MLARNPMSPVRDPIQDKINIYFVFRYHSHFLYGLVSIGIEGKNKSSPAKDKRSVLFDENELSKFLFRYPNQWREIAIDPQVKTADGQLFDIIFVGTDKV